MEQQEQWNYYQQLIQIESRLLQCYADIAVTTGVQGKMEAIRGISLSASDLFQLHDVFSLQEQQQYYKTRFSLYQEYALMHRKLEKQWGEDIPLEKILQALHADEFARHCVFLAFVAELDRDFSRAVAHLQNDYNLTFPTMEFCLATYTLNAQEQQKLLMDAKANNNTYCALFEEFEKDQPIYIQKGMKLRNQVMKIALCWQSISPQLEHVVDWYKTTDESLPPLMAQKEVLERMCSFDTGTRRLLISFFGPSGCGKKLQIRHFCKSRQKELLVVNLARISKEQEKLKETFHQIATEAAIRKAYIAFDNIEAFMEPSGEEGELFDILQIWMEEFWKSSRILFFLGREKWQPKGEKSYGFLSVSLGTLSVEERLSIWEGYLHILPVGKDVNAQLLAGKFPFTGGMIRNSVMTALEQMQWQQKSELDNNILHEACNNQIVLHMNQKATRIESGYCWEDLVLPPRQKSLLQDACNQILFEYKVYKNWNFGGKVAYGRGVSMLFTGPPGTGKTMAAQVMANALQMELFKVDLSGVISKYVGETEKNLGAIFDEMKKSKNILFFDEADALFGKRSEVKDSHDKYANAQTAYLLQKMEEYDGIIILATNFMQNFDEAFKRRLKFVVDFPFPDEAQRLTLWQKVFPKQTPLGMDVDFEYLSQRFSLSGSNIKNVAVSAAFLAAAEKEATPVCMVHLLTAVQREYEKLGKTLTAGELGEYAGYLELRK